MRTLTLFALAGIVGAGCSDASSEPAAADATAADPGTVQDTAAVQWDYSTIPGECLALELVGDITAGVQTAGVPKASIMVNMLGGQLKSLEGTACTATFAPALPAYPGCAQGFACGECACQLTVQSPAEGNQWLLGCSGSGCSELEGASYALGDYVPAKGGGGTGVTCPSACLVSSTCCYGDGCGDAGCGGTTCCQ